MLLENYNFHKPGTYLSMVFIRRSKGDAIDHIHILILKFFGFVRSSSRSAVVAPESDGCGLRAGKRKNTGTYIYAAHRPQTDVKPISQA